MLPLLMSHEHVQFTRIKDSMGATVLSIYLIFILVLVYIIKYSILLILDENIESKMKIEEDHNNCEKDSLSRTILSLDSAAAKQNALQHVLNALRITLAREIVLAALIPPSNDGKKLYCYQFCKNSCTVVLSSFSYIFRC